MASRFQSLSQDEYLQYLGRKTGMFYPTDEIKRIQVEQWLMWQMSGGWADAWAKIITLAVLRLNVSPMPAERYVNESKRLYGVLNKQLVGQDYVAGESRLPIWRYSRGCCDTTGSRLIWQIILKWLNISIA